MKTGTRIVGAALVSALALAASTGLSAADPWTLTTLQPAKAASFDTGTRRVTSSFQTVDGACKLTLTIDEAGAENAAKASRLELSVEPGRNVQFDAADGKAMRFACLGRAQAMSVTTLGQVALNIENR